METWPVWKTTQTVTATKSLLPYVGKYPNFPAQLTLHLPRRPTSLSTQRKLLNYAPPASSLAITKREILLADLEDGLTFSLALSPSTDDGSEITDNKRRLTFDKTMCDYAASQQGGTVPPGATTLGDLFDDLFAIAKSSARVSHVNCTADYKTVVITLRPMSIRRGSVSATNFAFLRLFPLEVCPTPDAAESIPASELPLYSRCQSDYIWRQLVDDVPVKTGLRRVTLLPPVTTIQYIGRSAIDAKVYAGGIHASSPNLPVVLRNAVGYVVRLTYGGNTGAGDGSDLTLPSTSSMASGDFLLIQEGQHLDIRQFLRVSNYMSGVVSFLFLPWSFFLELQIMPTIAQLFPRANGYCNLVADLHLSSSGESEADLDARRLFGSGGGVPTGVSVAEPYLFTEDRGITTTQSQAMNLLSPFGAWAFLADPLFFNQLITTKNFEAVGHYEFEYAFVAILVGSIGSGFMISGAIIWTCLWMRNDDANTEDRQRAPGNARERNRGSRPATKYLKALLTSTPLTAVVVCWGNYFTVTWLVALGQAIAFSQQHGGSSNFPWPEKGRYGESSQETPNLALKVCLGLLVGVLFVVLCVAWLRSRTNTIMELSFIPHQHLPRVLAARSRGCWGRYQPDITSAHGFAVNEGGTKRQETEYARAHQLYITLQDMLILTGLTGSGGGDVEEGTAGRRGRSSRRGGSRSQRHRRSKSARGRREGADLDEEVHSDDGEHCYSFFCSHTLQFTKRLFSRCYLALSLPSWISEGSWRKREKRMMGNWDGTLGIFFMMRHLKGSVVYNGLFNGVCAHDDFDDEVSDVSPTRHSSRASSRARERDEVDFDDIDELSMSLTDNEVGSQQGGSPTADSMGGASRYSPRERKSIRETRSSDDRGTNRNSSSTNRQGSPQQPTSLLTAPVVIGSGEASDQAFRLRVGQHAAKITTNEEIRKRQEEKRRQKSHNVDRRRRLRKAKQQHNVGLWVLVSPLLVYTLPFLRNAAIGLLVGMAGRYDVCNDESDVNPPPFLDESNAAYAVLGILLASSAFFAISRPFIVGWQSFLHAFVPIAAALPFIFAFAADSRIIHQDDLLTLSDFKAITSTNAASEARTLGILAALFSVLYGILVLWVGVWTLFWMYKVVEKFLVPEIEGLLTVLEVDNAKSFGAEMVLIDAMVNMQRQQSESLAAVPEPTVKQQPQQHQSPVSRQHTPLPATRPPRAPTPSSSPSQQQPPPQAKDKIMRRAVSIDSLDLDPAAVSGAADGPAGYVPPAVLKPHATKPPTLPTTAPITATATSNSSPQPRADADMELTVFDDNVDAHPAASTNDRRGSLLTKAALSHDDTDRLIFDDDDFDDNVVTTMKNDSKQEIGDTYALDNPPPLPLPREGGTDRELEEAENQLGLRAPAAYSRRGDNHFDAARDADMDLDLAELEAAEATAFAGASPISERTDSPLLPPDAKTPSPDPAAAAHGMEPTTLPPMPRNTVANSAGSVQVDEEFFFVDDWGR